WVQPGVTGYVFRTGDPHELAEQLTTLLSLATSANRPLSEQARALVVERANWEANLHRLRDALTVNEI
ncbi:MAG TPA: alpha-(1-2)-phosphatidylinositol mannosyltransferase, partial [Acidimicrobiia bacterium]